MSAPHQITLHQTSQGLNGIAYTRAEITPWPNITWNSRLGRLLLNGEYGITVPDAIIKSANQRRRLYNAFASGLKAQRDFDKPSSAYFLPPEYQAINCAYELCILYGVGISAPASTTVNTVVGFAAEASYADSGASMDYCTPLYKFSTGGTSSSWSMSNAWAHTFAEPGQHVVSVQAMCQCGIFGLLHRDTVGCGNG